MSAPSHLMPEERPIAVSRQHWVVCAPWVLLGALVAMIGAAALLLAPGAIAGWNTLQLKALVVVVLLLALAGWTGSHYLRWRLNTFMLTDRRIIVERGVLSRSTESISLDRIQNTIIRRPFADRIIGAGDIEIESAGRDGVETLHRIPDAQSFYSSLVQAMDALRTGSTLQQRRSL